MNALFGCLCIDLHQELCSISGKRGIGLSYSYLDLSSLLHYASYSKKIDHLK